MNNYYIIHMIKAGCSASIKRVNFKYREEVNQIRDRITLWESNSTDLIIKVLNKKLNSFTDEIITIEDVSFTFKLDINRLVKDFDRSLDINIEYPDWINQKQNKLVILEEAIENARLGVINERNQLIAELNLLKEENPPFQLTKRIKEYLFGHEERVTLPSKEY